MKKSLLIFGLMLLVCVVSVNAVPQNGVSYWSLDNTLVDEWSSHDFTNNGVAFDTSYPTFGISGDGATHSAVFVSAEGDYLTAGDLDDFSFTDGAGNDLPFTICSWVYFDNIASGGQTIINKYTTGAVEFNIFTFTTGAIGVDTYTTTTSDYIRYQTANSQFASTTFYHLCVVGDGTETTSAIKIYKNGASLGLSTSTAGTYTGMTNTNSHFAIGAVNIDTTPISQLNGKVDEIQVYSTNLSDSQVEYLYNYGELPIDAFVLTLKDAYAMNNITSFTADFYNGSTTTIGTTNGTIYYPNDQVVNITIYNTSYFDKSYENYDTMSSLDVIMYAHKFDQPENNTEIKFPKYQYPISFNISNNTIIESCDVVINESTIETVSVSEGQNIVYYDFLNNQSYNWTVLCNSTGAEYEPRYFNFVEVATSIDGIAISNVLPIRSNDPLDLNFNISDENRVNLSINSTWFKSDDNVTWSQHIGDDEEFGIKQYSEYNGITLHTSAQGDVEAEDTNAWQYWKGSIVVVDDLNNTYYMNTTEYQIYNDPPNITGYSSGTTNDNTVNYGDFITFELNGTDLEYNSVTMKVCSNSDATFDTCQVLCQNLTGVTFSGVVNTSITCVFEALNTTRENYAYAILTDPDNETASVNISYFVNQYPILADFSMQDTTGDTTYFFGEYIDYFKINWSDPDNDTFVLQTYITVKDPEDVIKVDNQSMNYTTDMYLDAVGTWSYSIYVVDSDGAKTWYNDTFDVTSISLSTGGRIFGYDFESLPTYAIINTTIDTYDYYIAEVRINSSTTWSEVSDIIQTMKNNSQLITLTLYDNLSDIDTTLSFIDTNYADLIDADHLNAIRHLKVYVDDAALENASNSILVNNITKKIFQKVANKFPIFIRNYNHTDINTNYGTADTYIYITADSNAGLINSEIGYLRNSTSLSRYYYNISDSLKTKTASWQSDIINKMRSTLNISTAYSDLNVAELLNGDLIVVNNLSESISYNISTIGVTEPHAYVLTNKRLATGVPSDSINVTVSQESGVIIYFTNLTKIVIESDDDKFLYAITNRTFDTNKDLTDGDANAFLFGSSSANPDDGRIFFTDPSFNPMGFYVWYGTNQFEAIANWSRYDKVILGDNSNGTWIGEVANDTTVFGYTSVNTYGTDNYPLGCTIDVDCTDWNRSYWLDTKKAAIDNWTNTREDINVFIDGLDIGAVNDVDGQFGDGLVELSDYVKLSKQRELVLNTYTSYEDYANLGDYTMRESACGRWDGTVNSPTYSYEDINLEITRANFHTRHGLPVLAQVFGNITDYEKSYYCFMQTKVLYGDLAEVSYNQPKFEYTGADEDFQWNYYKYPDLGNELEEEYTTIGTDSYRRRFENGIVTVNTTDHTVDFVTNDVIESIQICGYFYDNDDGTGDEGEMRFILNDDQLDNASVSDTTLSAFVKTYACAYFNTSSYEPSGFYEIEFYYRDYDANYLNNNGLYMYHGTIVGEDRLSDWEQILNGHQSNDETDYWQFATGDNWALNFTINRISTESAIDELTTVIDRNSSGVEKVNVTINSDYAWTIETYDKTQLLNKSRFNGIYVGNTLLNTSNDNCDSDNPTYNTTTISGEVWKSCVYNTTPNEFYVKVVIPSLSEKSYIIDGNTPPQINESNIELINLTEGNQVWQLNYSYYDADNNEISLCKVSVNNTNYTMSPSNNLCTINITNILNSTSYAANIIVLDEYSTESTDGETYEFATIVYDGIQSSNLTGNLTVQYFNKYWNISQNNGDFNDILWNYENLSSRTIDITNVSTRDYLNYSTNLISYSDYDYTPDGSNQYFVDAAEEVFRYFNVSANLSTGEEVPVFNISLEQERYVSGIQSMNHNCGSYDAYTNFTSGSVMSALVQNLSDSSEQCYQYIYRADIIYTDSTITSSVVGDTTTYEFVNEDASSYGAKIEYMFDELRNTSIDLTYTIQYSTLPNFASRDTLSYSVYEFDAPSTYTLQTVTSDYTFTNNAGDEYISFNWASTPAPLTNLFTDLSYTYVATTEPPVDEGDGGAGVGGGAPPPTASSDIEFVINPTEITFSATAGTRLIKELTITNLGDDITIDINVVPSQSPTSASSWTTLESGVKSGTLDILSSGGLSGDIRYIGYYIDIPDDTANGEYTATITFESGDVQESLDITVVVEDSLFTKIREVLSGSLFSLGEVCVGEFSTIESDGENIDYCPEDNTLSFNVTPTLLIAVALVISIAMWLWASRRKKK